MFSDLFQIANEAAPEASIEATPQSFSLFEMIFWYSALVVMILVFVIYRKAVKSDKKRLTNAIDRVTKNINELDKLIGQATETSKFKEYSKGLMNLSSVENTLIAIYDKTKLQDIDKALTQIKKIEKVVKKNSEDKPNYKKYLMNVKREYDKLLDLMLVIVRLVK